MKSSTKNRIIVGDGSSNIQSIKWWQSYHSLPECHLIEQWMQHWMDKDWKFANTLRQQQHLNDGDIE